MVTKLHREQLLSVDFYVCVPFLKSPNLLKSINTGLHISKISKHLESSSVHTLSVCPNLVKYSFKNMYHPVFNGDPIYKLRRVKGT